jgi:conjugative relaxase-like TrwC/TraI family protein
VVTVGKVTKANRWYYESQVAQGREDYYSDHGEAPGRWVGAWSCELGLAGTASTEQAKRMLDGCDPVTGAQLYYAGTKRGRPRTVQAYDLTFSAPKSVSVLWACVRDRGTHLEIQEAHDCAIDEAIKAIEKEALFDRKGREASKALGIAYRHRFSREADPQLHTHVLVANMAEGTDGCVRSLDGKAVYHYAKVARRHYHAALREGLTQNLGLAWTEVNSQGLSEIQGISSQVRSEFSQRRKRLLEHMQEREAAGAPVNPATAALDTRPPKPEGIDFESEREGFRARAEEHGLDEEAIQALLWQTDTDSQRLTEAELENLEQKLVGRNGLTAHQNTFTEADATCALLDAAPLGMREGLRSNLQRLLARDEVVSLAGDLYTTRALLAREREIVQSAKRRRSSSASVLDTQLVEGVLDRHSYLNDSQRRAVRSVTKSGHGIENIEAMAGTGKTTVLGVIAEAYREAGHDVQGLAPSARAARELESVGIESRTHHSLVLALQRGYGLSTERPTVLLADEHSMTGTFVWCEILSAAEAYGAKVIQVGDSGQLPAVEPGGSFAAISNAFGAERLTEVVRQRELAERRALKALHEARPDPFVFYHARKGTLNTYQDSEEAILAAVSSWWRAQEDTSVDEILLIAFSRTTREALNEKAREILEREGLLAGKVLVAADGTQIQAGERVIARQNDYGLGIENGTRGTVADVDTDAHGLRLFTDDGCDIYIEKDYLDRGALEHAYAITGHMSQGTTVEEAIVVGSPKDFTREWAYTVSSRAKETTQLHIHPPETGELEPPHAPQAHDLIDEIRRNLARSRADELSYIRQAEPETRSGGLNIAQEPSVSADDREARRELARLHEERRRLKEIVDTYPQRTVRELEHLQSTEQNHMQGAYEAEKRLEAFQRELDAMGPFKKKGKAGDELLRKIEATQRAKGSDEEKAQTARSRIAEIRQGPDSPQLWEKQNAGVKEKLQSTQRRLERQIEQVAEHSIDYLPAYVRGVLGERPTDTQSREHYDTAVRAIERYRLSHEVAQTEITALGSEPDHGKEQYNDWLAAANRVLDAREALGLDRGDAPFSERMSRTDGLVPESSLERIRGRDRGFGLEL